MKLIQIFDSHWRDEEPFYVAAEAMVIKLFDEIMEITNGEAFILIHGGDVFHRSKETGRANGLVLRFFTSILSLPDCKGIYIIQGNHDVKKETGSALDFLSNIDDRLKIIKEPDIMSLWDEKYLYALPHMPAYTLDNFKGISTYEDPQFHEIYYGTWAHKIAITVGHFGDETSGDFFKQVDVSFLPGVKCNGHIHKRVSANYPGSIMITRRDEIDKISYVRVFENDLERYTDVSVECAFNYLKIKFGEDVLAAYEAMEVKPYGSLIVDVQGHNDEAAVIAWFDEQKSALPIPAFLGSVYPDEKQSDTEYEINVSGDEQKFDIRALFAEFCKEKGVDKDVQKKIEVLL
jgi:DNA repair exonuclease SbcCD nuclease subunit